MGLRNNTNRFAALRSEAGIGREPRRVFDSDPIEIASPEFESLLDQLSELSPEEEDRVPNKFDALTTFDAGNIFPTGATGDTPAERDELDSFTSLFSPVGKFTNLTEEEILRRDLKRAEDRGIFASADDPEFAPIFGRLSQIEKENKIQAEKDEKRRLSSRKKAANVIEAIGATGQELVQRAALGNMAATQALINASLGKGVNLTGTAGKGLLGFQPGKTIGQLSLAERLKQQRDRAEKGKKLARRLGKARGKDTRFESNELLEAMKNSERALRR